MCSVVQYTIRYCTVQYNSVQFSTVQYNTIRGVTFLFCAIQFREVQKQYSTIQYHALCDVIVQCSTVDPKRSYRPAIATQPQPQSSTPTNQPTVSTQPSPTQPACKPASVYAWKNTCFDPLRREKDQDFVDPPRKLTGLQQLSTRPFPSSNCDTRQVLQPHPSQFFASNTKEICTMKKWMEVIEHD